MQWPWARARKSCNGDPERTVAQQLQASRTLAAELQRRHADLCARSQACLARARSMDGVNMSAAVFYMRQKKQVDAEVTRMHGHLLAQQDIIHALEQASIAPRAIEDMRSSAAVLTRAQTQQPHVDAVEDVMFDVREAMQQQDDASHALASDMQDVGGFEDDLLAEMRDFAPAGTPATPAPAAAPTAAAPAAAAPAASVLSRKTDAAAAAAAQMPVAPTVALPPPPPPESPPSADLCALEQAMMLNV